MISAAVCADKSLGFLDGGSADPGRRAGRDGIAVPVIPVSEILWVVDAASAIASCVPLVVDVITSGQFFLLESTSAASG